MTTTQEQQLASLFIDYGNKKAAYEAATNNLNAILGMAPSPSVNAQKIAAMQAKDAAKTSMDNALTAYNNLRDDFAAQDQAAFIAANPQVAVQIAQTQVDTAIGIAQAQATGTAAKSEVEAKAAADAAKAEEDAKTKKTIIIVAVVVTVVVIGVIVYKKFFSNKN